MLKSIIKSKWTWILIAVILVATIGYIGYKEWQKLVIYKNDALASSRSRELFQALEQYLFEHKGEFPKYREDLAKYQESGMKLPYCNDRMDGYVYECIFSMDTYGVKAYPIKMKVTGNNTITNSKSLSYVTKYDMKPIRRGRFTLLNTDEGLIKKDKLIKKAQECRVDLDCTVLPRRAHPKDPCYVAINRYANVEELLKTTTRLSSKYHADKCENKEKLRAVCSENMCTTVQREENDGNVKTIGSKKYTYNDLGTLLSEESFKNGKLDGTSITYSDLAYKFQENTYQNGKKHGAQKSFTVYGNLEAIGNYKDGNIDGMQISFHRNDTAVQTEALWRSNKMIYSKSFDKDGRLVKDIKIVNGTPCNRYYNKEGKVTRAYPKLCDEKID